MSRLCTRCQVAFQRWFKVDVDRSARALFEIALCAAIAISLIAPFWPDR